ncbi:MAG: NAD(P)/FAD-dependent oxidoreductase [Gemmatimonadales bacterium]
MSALPESIPYLVIGAGVHGLSTAYHLAVQLKARGKGSGGDILVVDKTGVAAGASGIACGAVRNDYAQPAMRRLVAHSVEVWESDPEAFSYHSVGRLLLAPTFMEQQVATVYESQREIGYPSTLVEGKAACMKYMRDMFSDWKAPGTIVLHEKKGGYANNKKMVQGLAAKATGQGVRILSGVTVTGFRLSGGAVTAVETDQGSIDVDHVIIGAGPWIKGIWEMLDLPKTVTLRLDGKNTKEVRMWNYYRLEEGTLGVDPKFQLTNDGKHPPIVHVDSDLPLYSDIDRGLITDEPWGIYFKPDFDFGGVQGGSTPFKLPDPDTVKVDPYGPKSPEFVVGKRFVDLFCSALAFCQKRFEGKHTLYKREPSGGIGAFTADNFPVFDVYHQNCYIIADSNHGFKMIGVGKLVAGELLGERSSILQPFRYSRFAEGKQHKASKSPFPWA